MLTYEDCLCFSALSDDVITAIAERQHVPCIVAMEMGETLLSQPGGALTVRQFIVDGMEHARHRGDLTRFRGLKGTLASFDRAHASALMPLAAE